MKKIFTSLFFSLIAVVAMAAYNRQYYVGPTDVTVTTATYSGQKNYKVTINQKGRNLAENTGTLYSSKTVLYLIPSQDRLEGVYSSNNTGTNNRISIGEAGVSSNRSHVWYKEGTTEHYRYLNTAKESTFTIAKAGQDTYYIVDGSIFVKDGDNTYEYYFCYDQGELTNPVSEIGKKPFEFTTTFTTGTYVNYDMRDIHDKNVDGSTLTFACTGDNRDTKVSYAFTVSLNFETTDIQGEFSNVCPATGKSILSSSTIKTGSVTRRAEAYLSSHLQIVKDAEDNLTICGGTLQATYSGDGVSPRNYHFAETVKIDDSKANNEVLLNSCSKLVDPIANVQLIRSLTSASYNTFCAPFDMNAAQITEVFGAGADIRALESSSYDAEENEFTLNFSTTSLTEMEAGKPYLVKPSSSDVANPKFSSIEPTAFATAAKTVSTSVVDFVGVLSPFTLEADDETILFLASGNELKYSKAGTMKGMRGYFKLNQPAPAGARARIVMEKETTTGVENVSSEKKHGEPTKRLVNGQLVIIRDGKMYNVQGVQL